MDEIIILQEAFTGKFKTVSYAAHAAHLVPQGWFLHLFGQNELGVRFWPALLGTLAVPAIFAWMTWTAGKFAGRITAILACLNCFLIYYSQDGNYYGGMTFYTAIMLCGFAMFFRGAPYAGLFVTIVFGIINYKNHPIAALPFAAMIAVMGIASIADPRLRKMIYSAQMDEWKGRPAIPILCVGGIVGFFFVAGAWDNLKKSIMLLAEPGEGTLKNVEAGWTLFFNHIDAFGVNFYRQEPFHDLFNTAIAQSHENAIAFVILVIAIVGAFLFTWSHLRASKGFPWIILLIILTFAGSYYLLFSIQLKRNFYIRYFTYLVPLYLACLALFLEFLGRMLTNRIGRMGGVGIATAIIALPSGYFSFRYLLADKRNEKEGIKILKKEAKPDDKFILLTRQDRIAANYYFQKEGLPTQSPIYTILQQPDSPGAMTNSFPYVINGMRDTWIVSGWRFPGEYGLYAFVNGALEKRFSGTSKLGEDADLWLRFVRGDERIIYENASVIFANNPKGRVLVTDITIGCEWSVRTPEFPEGVNFSHPLIIDLPVKPSPPPPSSTIMKWIPKLKDDVLAAPINWPEHSSVSGRSTNITTQRDGSFDYLIYQPENQKRHLAVSLHPRDENDPILAKNDKVAPPIPSGMLLGVAVDGIHKGFYRIPSGKPDNEIIINPDLELSPGNHRITITGTQPRAYYSPYFSWGLEMVRWISSNATPDSSLEEKGEIILSPGWPALLNVGTPGERPSREWTFNGDYETIVDPELKCVAGDSPIRVSFPPRTTGIYTLLTPVMPVEPGTLAVYTMYLKLEGLDDHEVTPLHLFISKDGKQIPNVLHANGANLRGTTLGAKGWVRRQITVPVPRDAKFMMGGVRVYPVPNGNTTGGKLWIGSVFSPGAGDLKLKDPILPDNYFGVSESTPLPVADGTTR
ncbi:MAG TPA: hypothetical protein PKH51_00215 [Candidatus Sumerlaeota bacterium]|nr:hypothetical protein [Candidatus Sumerlaeota bacterium]